MRGFIGAVLSLAMVAPVSAWACACGCGVFSVANPSLLPTDARAQIFVEYDFMDQNQNWSGASRAPAADNADKEIRTSFYTFGGQYMITRQWGVMVEVPLWNRTFRTDPGGGVQTFNHSALGDVRLMGVYAGLAKDQSTGILFGVKLPTGDFSYPGFDRDTAIGTGSTDLLLGGYHRGALNRAETWGWFVQGLWDRPLASQGGYAPGAEVDAAAGVSWAAATLSGGKLKIAPILQFIGSGRAGDGGPKASPAGSGYRRLLISPGVQFSAGQWRLYGDVELSVAQSYNGDQLAAPALFKVTLSRDF